MRRQENTTAIIITVVVGLLLAIAIGATAIFSSGFTNWDVSTWTWSFAPPQSEESKEEQTEEVTDETTTVSSAMRLTSNKSILIAEELDKEDLIFTYNIVFENDGGFFEGSYRAYVEDTDTFYMGLEYDTSKLISSALTEGSTVTIMSTVYDAVPDNDENYIFNFKDSGDDFMISDFSEYKGRLI